MYTCIHVCVYIYIYMYMLFADPGSGPRVMITSVSELILLTCSSCDSGCDGVRMCGIMVSTMQG